MTCPRARGRRVVVGAAWGKPRARRLRPADGGRDAPRQGEPAHHVADRRGDGARVARAGARVGRDPPGDDRQRGAARGHPSCRRPSRRRPRPPGRRGRPAGPRRRGAGATGPRRPRCGSASGVAVRGLRHRHLLDDPDGGRVRRRGAPRARAVPGHQPRSAPPVGAGRVCSTIAEAVGQHVIARGIDDEADLGLRRRVRLPRRRDPRARGAVGRVPTIIDLHPSLAGSPGQPYAEADDPLTGGRRRGQFHRRARDVPQDRAGLRRCRDRPACRRVGARRHLPGTRALHEDGVARPPRRHLRPRLRRRRRRRPLLGDPRRGAGSDAVPRASRWPSPCRPTWPRRRCTASVRPAEGALPPPRDRGPSRRGDRGDRARRRLRRGRDPHQGRSGTATSGSSPARSSTSRPAPRPTGCACWRGPPTSAATRG